MFRPNTLEIKKEDYITILLHNKALVSRICHFIAGLYYVALSHKDWELPNSRIWLAEMDIDRGLDFPI